LGDGWRACVHPDDGPVIEAATRSFEEKKPFEIIFRLRRYDGEYRWMLDSGVPRLRPDGSFDGFVGSCVDVTERKVSRDELEALAKKLERSNKDLEQFAYVASHDLQEPLRKIIAFSDRLKERKIAGMGDLERDYFDRMQGAARRMKTMIEDLLNFSRAATREEPRESVRLEEAVREAIGDLE
jgi:signal transduction histidine kinase